MQARRISLACIEACSALKPNPCTGLYANKPGFYPRLYGTCSSYKLSCTLHVLDCVCVVHFVLDIYVRACIRHLLLLCGSADPPTGHPGTQLYRFENNIVKSVNKIPNFDMQNLSTLTEREDKRTSFEAQLSNSSYIPRSIALLTPRPFG